MMACHVVTWDEITKLQEFTTSSDQPLPLIAYMETGDFLLCKTIYIFLKGKCLRKELKNI